MATIPSIIFETPQTLVAAIPHLLGFPPKQSVVVVALVEDEEGVNVALTTRYPLPLADRYDQDAGRDFAAQIAADAARAGSTNLLVTVWEDRPPLVLGGAALDLPHKGLFDALDELLDEDKLDGFEMVYTNDKRIWSYNCDEPCCGEVWGLQIQEADRTNAAVNFPAAGNVLQPNREAVAAEVAYTHNEDVMKALNTYTAAGDWNTFLSITGRGKVVTTLHDLAARGGPFTAAETAATVIALHNIPIRDTFLWDLNQQGVNQQPAIQLLTEVVRSAPDTIVAPAATVLAMAHYTSGDDARANACADRALKANPSYSLAGLLDQALTNPVSRPSDLIAVFRNTARETCLGTDLPAFNPNPPTLDDLHLAPPTPNISLER